MSRFGFSALSNLWLFALIAPLLLFYFLKLRRPRVIVSSLALWQSVLNDSRVNAPFQRFKRNLLLLLQLLLLLFAILAALQPYVRMGPASGDRIPVLIDCSASMAALDRSGGLSRLDAAKERVGDRIDGMLRGQQMCLVSFAAGARRVTGFTDNRRVLREALAGIEVLDLEGDADEALRVAQALGRTEPFDEVLLYSDGNLPPDSNFELPFKVQYELIPGGGGNLGITELNAARGVGKQWEVFVQIEGSAKGGSATLEIVQDGVLLDDRMVAAEGDTRERLSLMVDGAAATTIDVRLKPARFDALSADNTARIRLPALRPLSVYTPERMAPFRFALRTIPGLKVFPTGDADVDAAQTGYDLIIANQMAELDLPAAVHLGVGVIPADLESVVDVGEGGTAVVDWQRTAAILRHVNLGDLIVMEKLSLREGAELSMFDAAGYEILIHGTHAPLLLRHDDPARLAYYVLFDAEQSTLPYRVGFPVFVQNLVQQAYARLGMHEVRAASTGVLEPVLLEPAQGYAVRGPLGTRIEKSSDAGGTLEAVAAPHVGDYIIEQDGTTVHTASASLLSPQESGLAQQRELSIGELTVSASLLPMETDRPLWSLLAILALLVMLVEWWFYQRRIRP